MATVFLQGVFTVYLATSESIISDIFGRREQFPIIFGVVAIGFGVAAMANGRLVQRFGIDRVVAVAFACILPLSLLLVVETLGSEEPSFWVFMPTLTCVLSTFLFLMPNLNSAAMEPVGHLAGYGVGAHRCRATGRWCRARHVHQQPGHGLGAPVRDRDLGDVFRRRDLGARRTAASTPPGATGPDPGPGRSGRGSTYATQR